MFDALWNFIVKRSADACIPVVQDRAELEHIFGLLRNCNSYLEIGSAEGNSLYVLTKAMPAGSRVTYVDLGEKHTTPHRDFILEHLKDYKVTAIHGDSNDPLTARMIEEYYDAVFIDAGHSEINVIIDALFYGSLAKKYIIFHDVQLEEVRRAFDWYTRSHPNKKNYKFINSPTYGYGVIVLE